MYMMTGSIFSLRFSSRKKILASLLLKNPFFFNQKININSGLDSI
ncbi:hypothetical protein C2W63_03377 [Bacillus velezensis]|nr:hypothetical protein C2W63_03377 [Bacillus velezensis]